MSLIRNETDLYYEMVSTGQSQFQMELVAQERATAQRLQQAYQRLLAPTRTEIARLEREATTLEDFTRMADLEVIEATAREALENLDWMLQAEAERLTASAIQTGLGYAEMASGLTTGWNAVDPAAVRQLANYVDRPAMRAAISQWAPYHAERIADLALTGMAKGWNPRRTAQMMAAYVDNMPLADASRMMQTVQVWSYRTANIVTWRENSQVVQGWWWKSTLDDRACIGCISMHGTQHTLDEMLDDHHRGHCTPIPLLAGRAVPGEDAGREWFERQSIQRQMSIMGRARWLAWQDGAYDWRQLNRTYEDPIYGTMRTETPLQMLVGGDTAQGYLARARAERAA